MGSSKPAPTTLVIGGCRSGKSRFGLDEASRHIGRRNLFVATCVPHDQEMRQRVERHQQERSADWATIEVPLELPRTIRRHGSGADVILVDCLTLWISNLLAATAAEEEHAAALADLAASIRTAACPVVLVSNEVGTGVVPDNALARRFRDLAGHVNQQTAEVCQQVYWMVAGIPVKIK